MSDQANRVVYVEQRRHIVVNSPPPPLSPPSQPRLHHIPVVNQSAVFPETVHRQTVRRERKMFSQRAFNGIVFCIRIFILILAIVSMILILTAPGACFSRYLNGQSISRERELPTCQQMSTGVAGYLIVPATKSAPRSFRIIKKICPGQNSIFPMNADRWSNALHFQGRGQNVYGQVALICITLAFGLITVGVSCVTLATNSILTYPQILISGLSMIAFLVTGGVETWYATGYDHMEFFIQAVGNGVFSGCAGIPGCQIQFVVKGWAVAAAFYFLGALLYIVDMALIFISREKEVSDSYAVTTTTHY